MSQQNFDELRAIVSALAGSQLKNLKKLVSAFSSGNSRKMSKNVHLISVLEKYPAITYARARTVVGKGASARAFSGLVQRTLDRAKEYLNLELHREQQENGVFRYSEVTRAKSRIRQQLSQADFLFSYGYRGLAENAWHEMTKAARKFELFDELVKVLVQLEEMAVLRGDSQGASEIGQEIELAESKRTVAVGTKRKYYLYRLRVAGSGIQAADLHYLLMLLAEVREDILRAPSASATYYFRNLEAEYLAAIELFDAAHTALTRKLELVLAFPVVKQSQSIAFTHLQLAENDLHRFDLASATANLARAKAENATFVQNESFIHELEAIALAFQNRAAEALAAIQLAVATTATTRVKDLARRHYLKGAIHFYMGDAKVANYVLMTETRALDADTTGWNIGVRLLLIQTLIERNMHDDAARKINTMASYAKGLRAQGAALRERETAIVRILQTLERTGFDFELTAMKNPAHFAVLDSPEKGQRWGPFTYELIPFTAWFASKQKNTRLRFALPECYRAFLANLHTIEKQYEVLPVTP